MTVEEVAVFRKLQGGKPSYFITIANKIMPPSIKEGDTITLTIASYERWRRREAKYYEHLRKRIGKALLNNSRKISINKEIVESLGLKAGDVVWVRITPFTENPEPPKPYIALYRRLHSNKTSHFFSVAQTQINLLRSLAGEEASNIHVIVKLPDGTSIDYIKKPAVIEADKLYKFVLPSVLFEGKVRAGMTVWVKLTPTNKPEELYYTIELIQ